MNSVRQRKKLIIGRKGIILSDDESNVCSTLKKSVIQDLGYMQSHSAYSETFALDIHRSGFDERPCCIKRNRMTSDVQISRYMKNAKLSKGSDFSGGPGPLALLAS